MSYLPEVDPRSILDRIAQQLHVRLNGFGWEYTPCEVADCLLIMGDALIWEAIGIGRLYLIDDRPITELRNELQFMLLTQGNFVPVNPSGCDQNEPDFQVYSPGPLTCDNPGRSLFHIDWFAVVFIGTWILGILGVLFIWS